MTDIFISSAVRTAIGSFGGSLSSVPLIELATHVGKEAINRAGITPDKIQQTVFGNVIHTEPHANIDHQQLIGVPMCRRRAERAGGTSRLRTCRRTRSAWRR